MKNPILRIGAVEIFQVVELEAGELFQTIIRKATPEKIRELSWLCPHYCDHEGHMNAYVQSFLLRSGGKFILVDTCVGNNKVRIDVSEWANLQTDFLEKLESTGVGPSDISIVASTHLHMDHVGWNTKLHDGNWLPTFPNARYIIPQPEYDYWVQRPEKEISDFKAAFEDSVVPVVNSGQAELVAADHRIDEHIRFIPTPGHTPGHVSVFIESEGQSGIISGDIFHHPCQVSNPDWCCDADTLPELAWSTRINFLESIASTETLLINSHFGNPVFGKVIRSEGKYILQVAQ